MAKSTRKSQRALRERSRKSPQSRIPQAFQLIEEEATHAAAMKVPKLVLSGEWLQAVGFPIGSAAVLTTDRLGEITLHRLGLRLPRRLYLTAERRRPK